MGRAVGGINEMEASCSENGGKAIFGGRAPRGRIRRSVILYPARGCEEPKPRRTTDPGVENGGGRLARQKGVRNGLKKIDGNLLAKDAAPSCQARRC